VQLDTALISRSVIHLPWEPLAPGPVGELVEVIDIDPSSGCAYDPVDLDHHSLLAADGHPPSTGNPEFHQQMVYAVAMKTILNFKQTLGREVMWSHRQYDEGGKAIRDPRDRFVERLRIYPHALREANAYYSPTKKALLFGYFNARTADPSDEMPGGVVFTCLSHDIITHETTHAILDGMHRRLLDSTNQDMLAFHEAFADIVAIFQHFTLPGLLLDQIGRTRGDLRNNNLLAQLASQFARSTGRGSALRNALGRIEPGGRRMAPDPSRLGRTFEAHDRGAILVAAAFDAFLQIYENRSADLWRISGRGNGSGEDLQPDLARRLAHEAVEAAQRVLTMCIRALDYLPPVDVTFGDYLRALVTADREFFPEDPKRYRLAFIQSFRDHGIYPLDVRTLADDTLPWAPVDPNTRELLQKHKILPPREVLHTMAYGYDASTQLAEMLGVSGEGEGEESSLQSSIWRRFRDGNSRGAVEAFLKGAWLPRRNAKRRAAPGTASRRFQQFWLERLCASFLNLWIRHQAGRSSGDAALADTVAWNFGIDITRLRPIPQGPGLRLEVHAVRPTLRLRPDGRSKVELLVMLTQQASHLLPRDEDPSDPMRDEQGQPLIFTFRGGCTLLIDPDDGSLRYAIGKSLLSSARIRRQAEFLRRQVADLGADAIRRFGLTDEAIEARSQLEPFSLLHTHPIGKGTY
jgi:hypothetical protein